MRALPALASLAAVSAVAGCAESETGRLSGAVTYRGAPVSHGTVLVSRGDGDYRNVRFVAFSGGRYEVLDLVPGDHWVTLHAAAGVPASRDGVIPGLPHITPVERGDNTLDIAIK